MNNNNVGSDHPSQPSCAHPEPGLPFPMLKKKKKITYQGPLRSHENAKACKARCSRRNPPPHPCVLRLRTPTTPRPMYPPPQERIRCTAPTLYFNYEHEHRAYALDFGSISTASSLAPASPHIPTIILHCQIYQSKLHDFKY